MGKHDWEDVQAMMAHRPRLDWDYINMRAGESLNASQAIDILVSGVTATATSSNPTCPSVINLWHNRSYIGSVPSGITPGMRADASTSAFVEIILSSSSIFEAITLIPKEIDKPVLGILAV